jgi:hypothetical protein
VEHNKYKVDKEGIPRISLATIRNFTTKDAETWRTCKNKEATIFLDSGGTHNFIDIIIGKRLNVFIYPTKDLTMMVANGEEITVIGKCYKVYVEIHDFNLRHGFTLYHLVEWM